MLGFVLTTLFLARSLFLRSAKNNFIIAEQENIEQKQKKPDIYFKQTVDTTLTEELPRGFREERKKWLTWIKREKKKSFLSKIICYWFGAEQEPPCKVKKII
jgi:hypothetical protein